MGSDTEAFDDEVREYRSSEGLQRKGVGTEDHPWPCSQVGAIGKAIEANFEMNRK